MTIQEKEEALQKSASDIIALQKELERYRTALGLGETDADILQDLKKKTTPRVKFSNFSNSFQDVLRKS